MHELGIVFHIIKQVDEVAEQNQVKEVKKVVLEIGEVSGVIPKYLTDCWKWAVEHRSKYMKNCELEIISLKATSYCEDCKEMYDTMANGKICPHCHKQNTYLVTGNEVSIKDIAVI
ncbi:MAG: hydrogenase maturation nickel metallochaperone HypA [Bacilli bacterium]|nr:hydrogenase maturation nickel metallochaperone HypA [Bacilli bacterium]